MILITGNAAFDDICRPLKGKNEWGVDTLVRKVKGDRALAPAYIAGLAQGNTFSLGTTYYLQAWDADEDAVWATITLNYKGLAGGIPDAIVSNDIVRLSGTTSADYSLENGGRGRVYRKEVTYKPFPQQNVIDAEKDIYATGATMDFTYETGETIYRYITNGQPDAATHGTLAFAPTPRIIRARAVTSDGTSYGFSMPIAIGPSLQPAEVNRVVGFSTHPIIGTPYFECQDIVRTEME
jgi:hypothetical protein